MTDFHPTDPPEHNARQLQWIIASNEWDRQQRAPEVAALVSEYLEAVYREYRNTPDAYEEEAL